jgi:cytochrome c553
MRRVLTVALAVVCVGGFAWANVFAEKKTIKEVMKAGFAGDSSLCKKVVSGEANDEEKKKFLDLLIDLVENEPPKGDGTEWKMQSGTAMLAAAKVVTGREGSLEQLKAATNCKACHDKFKGK